jgi:hypothetical protein
VPVVLNYPDKNNATMSHYSECSYLDSKMSDFELVLDNANVVYDPTSHIITVTYQGVLDGNVTADVYHWLEELYKTISVNEVKGQIFDFRQVTRFDDSNLTVARRASNRMNMIQDTSQFPVALIVANPEQEEVLRGPMRIPEGHQRKRIVRSQQEALDFIHKWVKPTTL